MPAQRAAATLLGWEQGIWHACSGREEGQAVLSHAAFPILGKVAQVPLPFFCPATDRPTFAEHGVQPPPPKNYSAKSK